MDLNIIEKIFPPISNQSLLKYDSEGLWSISLPLEAKLITNIIKNTTINCNKIFDGTGGLGGNVLSFSKEFNNVTTCEINKKRFNLLVNNLDIFGIKNVKLIYGNCIDNLEPYADAYFFDPPWGGPGYKLNNKITIKIGEYNLIYLVEKIRKLNKSPIFIKLPNNYDLEEFSKHDYRVNKINKYILITFF